MNDTDVIERLTKVIALQTEIAKPGLNLAAMMELVTWRMRLLLRASSCAIELLVGGNLINRAASGLSHFGPGFPPQAGTNTLSQDCVRTGQGFLCNDTMFSERANALAAQGVRSVLVVPLCREGDVVGIMSVFARVENAFTNLDFETAQQLSAAVAAAIAINDAAHHAQTKDDAENFFYKATHDALTGLANRTYFYHRLQHDLSVAKRAGIALAVLIVVVENIKQVDAQHGRRAADMALVKVAESLSLSIRECDAVARIGEDEFAIEWTGIRDAGGAKAGIERIKARVEQPFAFADCTIEPQVGITLGYCNVAVRGIKVRGIAAAAASNIPSETGLVNWEAKMPQSLSLNAGE